MYSTTRDRAAAAAANAEHADTYGTGIPQGARKIAKVLALVVLGIVALVVFAHMLGHAWDVQYCQDVVQTFSGPTDHPEAVRCTAILNS